MELQDLTFNKEGDLYVCEFEATGPFNIKITRTNVSGAYGALSVQQSLTGEDYVPSTTAASGMASYGQSGF